MSQIQNLINEVTLDGVQSMHLHAHHAQRNSASRTQLKQNSISDCKEVIHNALALSFSLTNSSTILHPTFE